MKHQALNPYNRHKASQPHDRTLLPVNSVPMSGSTVVPGTPSIPDDPYTPMEGY